MNIRQFIVRSSVMLAAWVPVAVAAPPFTPGVQPTGWLGRPAVTGPITESGVDVSSGIEVAYRTAYDMADWSGEVQAREMFADGMISNVNIPNGWRDASLRLAEINWNSGRRIITMNGSSRIPFRWASLSSTQQAQLNGSGTNGNRVLDYLRGDRSNEAPAGDKFRTRATLLGDIVHSSLYYWDHSPDTDSLKRLYVGANDGMLHVLDAGTGTEVFAYIPSMLFPKLRARAIDPYAQTAYVDGQITMARVLLGTEKVVLVGGLGSGARGMYALDVTDPTAASESTAANKIMWEISPSTTGFANLGFVYGSARIARLNDGTAVAIFGNGYMNSGNGRTSLFIVNLQTGARIAEIDTGSGNTGSPGGLSTPTLLDIEADGKVDFAYAGDIDGKLWKFDLRNFTASLLFSTSPARAITVPPAIQPHPVSGFMVVFGTGRLLTAADATTATDNHVYGIWDGAPSQNNNLLDQAFEPETTRYNRRLRTISQLQPNWVSGAPLHRGWRVPLPFGEQVVGESPFHHRGRYYFSSTDQSVSRGANWANEIDFFTGGRPACPVYDIDEDGTFCPGGVPDPDDLAPDASGKVPVSLYLRSGVVSQPVLVTLDRSMVSTVYNWHPNVNNTQGTVEEPNTGVGLIGGHFDADAYALAKNTKKWEEITKANGHEYDDMYDVTGVNFVNASDPNFNLANFITDTTTQFKVLVMNQYVNPAATIKVGSSAAVGVRSYGGLAGKAGTNEQVDGKAVAGGTTATSVLAGLPSYTRSNVAAVVANMPIDALQSQNWWGTGGDVRAGLLPTQPRCVSKVSPTGASQLGPKGERFGGALAVQIIKANTPASALELNVPGDLRYGWRVKAVNFFDFVLAEYSVFWHHPNGRCPGEKDWIPNPPQDLGKVAKPATPAPGSADPRGSAGSGFLSGDVTTSSVTGGVKTTVRTVTYSDGLVVTITTEEQADGSVWKKIEDNRSGLITPFTCISTCGASYEGGFISPPEIPREEKSDATSGVRRESWREHTK